MARWCWLGIHKWSKWTKPETVKYKRYRDRYTHVESYTVTREEQTRTCSDCGKTELRIL